MAKIHAPNKQYTGISASVGFAKGIGETSDTDLIEWFKTHGYTVEEESKKDSELNDEFMGLSVDELKAYAIENDIDIGNSTSINGIIKKIQEAKKKAGE
ncbi:hypothetical protein LY28_00023 [Ruminiclostridium sufflavum DSM 19573]|uniref:Uncharacterized protein n=1 Tax=Ruminiclostridium sufflavum DSM 19573 TaxID=1121337 RepID=A0A318XTH9_9FIRM|nr:hypothetical protein [Ruminiclostridium sufflavum]PYG90143.1 hypothetical protein LY28_00023 [Ruminiclostridium sufflavum DSM 19573]